MSLGRKKIDWYRYNPSLIKIVTKFDNIDNEKKAIKCLNYGKMMSGEIYNSLRKLTGRLVQLSNCHKKWRWNSIIKPQVHVHGKHATVTRDKKKLWIRHYWRIFYRDQKKKMCMHASCMGNYYRSRESHLIWPDRWGKVTGDALSGEMTCGGDFWLLFTTQWNQKSPIEPQISQ